MKITNPLPTISPLALTDILFRKDTRIQVFMDLPEDKRIEMLRNLTKSVRKDVLSRIPEDELARMLELVDPDEATDYLQLLGKKRRERVLELISQNLRESLTTLLGFDAETAAGLMTLDYIQVETTDNIEDVALKFCNHEKKTGRPPVILITKDGKLKGQLPGHELGLQRKDATVGKFSRRIPSISYAASHSAVLQQFRAHPHGKVVVLNDSDAAVGIIYSDDMLALFEEQKASSLYKFAGINKEESVSDSAERKVHYRYRWLLINLATAFAAAFTIAQFEDTLAKYVLLAVYMPIVAGMGGNAATQTLAVVVRGISLKQIELKTVMTTLKNEVRAGFINGLINGIVVFLVVVIINHDVKVAAILGMAMIINLVVAGFFGTIVPVIMAKLGKDPATSATIFITTATDILGFLAFLGLATIVLD